MAYTIGCVAEDTAACPSGYTCSRLATFKSMYAHEKFKVQIVEQSHSATVECSLVMLSAATPEAHLKIRKYVVTNSKDCRLALRL